MNGETFSILVWCWHDLQSSTTQLRMVHVDTGEELHLSEGSFLLRFFGEVDSPVQRCLIRHMKSGREAFVQGGPSLRAFVKDCLLQSEGASSEGSLIGTAEGRASELETQFEAPAPGDAEEGLDI